MKRSLPEFSRILKRNPTPEERIFWGYLRRRPFGMSFSRQHVIGKYVADFFCEEWKLVIEIDGPDHQTAERRREDLEREEAMAALGITTMRFSNVEVAVQILWIDAEIGSWMDRERERRWRNA